MNKLIIVSAMSVMAFIAFVLLHESGGLRDGESSQAGSIEISDSLGYRHSVVYPEEFSAVPRVKIKLTKGSGNIEVIEQRTDGFVFTSSNLGYSIAEGAHVEWAAAGTIAK